MREKRVVSRVHDAVVGDSASWTIQIQVVTHVEIPGYEPWLA